MVNRGEEVDRSDRVSNAMQQLLHPPPPPGSTVILEHVPEITQPLGGYS